MPHGAPELVLIQSSLVLSCDSVAGFPDVAAGLLQDLQARGKLAFLEKRVTLFLKVPKGTPEAHPTACDPPAWSRPLQSLPKYLECPP